MRRPSPTIFALCVAALVTSAASLPAVLGAPAVSRDETLRASTAAAIMADEPSSAMRTVLDGLRAIRATTIGSGTDADGSTPGIRGVIPAASVSIVSPSAEVSTGNADILSVADDATARLLEEEGPGTYIDELLRVGGTPLTRWPARGETPVTYWIQPGAGLAGFVPDNRRRVDEAFAAWERAGIPLHFSAATDSARADILVVWTPRFNEPISGKTRWMHDRRGWIRGARVTIALHRYTGEQLSGDALHAIALHEVGHSLGLDHSSDAANVMAPRVRVRDLSDADRATARLLYRLPPGLRR